jgi:aminopeptidase N
MNRKILLVTLSLYLTLFCNLRLFAQAIDVLHYDINLLAHSFQDQTIQARTQVRFKVVQDQTKRIELELYQLQVDSIIHERGFKLDFDYQSPKITINFPEALRKDEEYAIQVYYKGKPAQDPKGFGGFFFRNNILFNIGVTMEIFPHNAGKMWFPCVDNFTDKATYTIRAVTNLKQTAVCGGMLTNVTTNDSLKQKTYRWNIIEPIPTYLASIAIGEYVEVKDTFQSQRGAVPVSIYVKPGGEQAVRGTYQKLNQTLKAFESLFGPYVWQRVGYVAVPFYAGAMEHAMNVAMPDITINGGTQFETLWAHELAHSWFGNLVTCSDAKDMWLNEGFARYCEAIFLEKMYNTTRSKTYLRKLHANTLKTGHYADGGYYPVSGIPHKITYGKTVYDKGALVAHALRAELGDELFFSSLKQYFKDYQFGNHTSEEFRDRLSQISGKNLTRFFDEWVFEPGYSQVELVSYKSVPVGNEYRVDLEIRQKRLARSKFLQGQEIDVMIITVMGDTVSGKVILNGEVTNISIQSPQEAKYVFLDPEEKLLDATVDHFAEVGKSGVEVLLEDLNVQFSSDNRNIDPCFVRVSRHFVSPSETAFRGLKWSNNYWSFERTNCSDDLPSLNLTLFYDGDTTTGFDRPWIENEDSIIVFYRAKATDQWTYLPNAELTTGFNKNDYRGDLYISNGAFGQYTLASRNGYVVGRVESGKQNPIFDIEPNPASINITLKLAKATENGVITIYNHLGQTVFTQAYQPNSDLIITINVSGLSRGIYNVQLKTASGAVSNRKLIIN